MNIVVIPNIKLPGSKRSDSYQYSIESWKHWCKKQNVELFILDELVYPIEEMKITWQRWMIFEILEANGYKLIDKIDQVALVDADTVIHPDCPFFFGRMTNWDFTGVVNDGDYEWVLRSIKNYTDEFFPGMDYISPSEYINNGMIILTAKHRTFCDEVIKFYWDNKDQIIESYDKFKVSTDQTIVNILRKQHEIKTTILPTTFNLQDLFRKNLLYVDERCWWEDTLENMYKAGYIYHFNAIPGNTLKRDANYWIKRTYEELYKK